MSETPTHTIAETAALFPGLSEDWFKRAVRKNLIPHFRPSRTVILFTDEDIAAIKRQFSVQPVKSRRAS